MDELCKNCFFFVDRKHISRVQITINNNNRQYCRVQHNDEKEFEIIISYKSQSAATFTRVKSPIKYITFSERLLWYYL